MTLGNRLCKARTLDRPKANRSRQTCKLRRTTMTEAAWIHLLVMSLALRHEYISGVKSESGAFGRIQLRRETQTKTYLWRETEGRSLSDISCWLELDRYVMNVVRVGCSSHAAVGSGVQRGRLYLTTIHKKRRANLDTGRKARKGGYCRLTPIP